MKLLINNVEQEQDYNSNDVRIVLYGRTALNPEKCVPITVHGFKPYFYALEEEVREEENFVLNQESVHQISYGRYKSIRGDTLTKVFPPKPQGTRDARELFHRTWEADVPFTRRFRIDTDVRAYIEVPETEVHYTEIKPVEPGSYDATPGGNTPETALQEVKPRVCTLDIEVDDRCDGFPERGEEMILSVVMHDSYTDKTHGFFFGDLPTEEELDKPEGLDTLTSINSEPGMLRMFAMKLQEMDPDILTGWNADDFDIPFLIKRFENLDGLDPSMMARGDWAGMTSRGEPRIKGRTVYDLLTVYKKNQFTKLRSYTLDYVAKEELGEEKIEFNGSYYDLYKNDPTRFLEYNAKDVELAVRINEEADVIEFRDILRREVGVDFEDSYDNKDFVDMMCRRKLREWGVAGPTRPSWSEVRKLKEEKDYEGAFVFPAYTGVASNVVGIDLASLYPYTMAMLNASPETKLSGDIDDDFNLHVYGQDNPALSGTIPVCVASNDQAFRRDKVGLFSSLVNDSIGLKAEYKEARNNAENDEEYKKWARKYNVAKTITNSLYGVSGWEPFFLYDEAVAEAVTLTGQTVLKKTAEYIEESGYDVIYGDTDSTYVKFPDEWNRAQCLHEARALCETLNNEVYPELAEGIGVPAEDNLWEIEVEVFIDTFFQAGRKKRYAYLATWKDGRIIEDPKPSVSGFHSRRSDTAQLTVDTEKEIFDAILSRQEGRVTDIVYDAAGEILCDDPDLDYIGIPSGMGKKIDAEKAGQDGYYAFNPAGFPQDAHPRAVWNSNQILNLGIGSGDKPKRIYVEEREFAEVGRSIDVLAFITASQLDPIADKVKVNKSRMLDALITTPFDSILSAIDIDVNAAVRGQTQTGLGAFG